MVCHYGEMPENFNPRESLGFNSSSLSKRVLIASPNAIKQGVLLDCLLDRNEVLIPAELARKLPDEIGNQFLIANIQIPEYEKEKINIQKIEYIRYYLPNK